MEDKSITLISAKLMFYAALKAAAMNDDENRVHAEKTLLELYARLIEKDKELFRGFVACVGMAEGVAVPEIKEMIFVIEAAAAAKTQERSGIEWDDLIKNVK